MPEIKRTFSGSKMNKDMDERLVPLTEYRDAKNIEVNTSDGSNVGTVQTTLGNTALTAKFPAGSVCVGSIVDKKTDKIYWLVAGASETTDNVTTFKDYIAEYDVQNETFKYVLVDIYKVKIVPGTLSSSTNGFVYCPQVNSKTFNNTGIRLDMDVRHTNASATAGVYVTDIQFDTDKWKILTSSDFATGASDTVTFKSKRLLNFQKDDGTGKPRMITGINVMDGMLFWTDNYSEPKKINIERCIEGTGGESYLYGGSNAGYNSTVTTQTYKTFGPKGLNLNNDNFHTRLVSTGKELSGKALETITNFNKNKAAWLEEEHITVIKKAPLTPPYLEMSNIDPKRSGNDIHTGATGLAFSSTSASGETTLLTPSEEVYATGTSPGAIYFTSNVDFRIGDVVILTNDTDADPTTFTDHEVRIRIEDVPTGTGPWNGPYSWSLLGVSSTIGTGMQNWLARLEQKPAIFEFKFPRFAYRYKYEDGEYSTFSPFSEIAFMPSDFNYAPKQGYNLGMVNDLRSLKITDFVVEDATRGEDVIEVDILFKNEDSPNIYTVKTIKKTDDAWPTTAKGRGEYTVETELIHAVVPSNQLLRPWDNVPRKALAQEISANRLIYGNYLQNYDLKDVYEREIIPDIQVSLESKLGALAKFNSSAAGSVDSDPTPDKSVKSLRTYQVGVVYRDEYGRETPVLTGDAGRSTITVDKEQSISFNKIKAQILSNPPNWAKSWKLFVKETSNEYYNLAMDRWYNAEDGNVWLSFPSAERNKVQEDSFLILKKEHDSERPVTEDARYKVIAIEDDAPEFIKTNTKTIGTMQSALNWVTSTTAGFPFVEYDSFDVQNSANFYSTFGIDGGLSPTLLSYMHQGFIYVRFSAATVTSAYYKIASITDDNNIIKIRIDGKFGEDLRAFAPAQTTASIVSGISFDIASKIPENKPEFDGKFFVKVYKDLTIGSKVLAKTSSSDYTVVTAMSPYYVNYSNVVEQGSSQNGSLIKDLAINNNDFNWWIYPPGTTSDSDLIPYINGIGVTSSTSDKNYRRAVRAWWQAFGGNWFIDSAITANEEVDTTPGGNSTNNWVGTYVAGSNAGHLGNGGHTDNNFISSGHHGVYNGGKNIVLSWSGLYLPGDSFPSTNKRINHIWGDPEEYAFGTAACHPDQQEVVSMLNPGNKFRFKDDPSKIVYTIMAVSRVQNLHNYDSDKNVSDKYHWAANKRLRYDLTVQDPNGDGIGVNGVGYNPTESGSSGNDTWTAADSNTPITIEFVEPFSEDDVQFSSGSPAIWETEPKEDVGLDIYYEATQAFPIDLHWTTNEACAKYGSIALNESAIGSANAWSGTIKVTSWSDQTVTLDTIIPADVNVNDIISFTAPDGGVTRLQVKTAVDTSVSGFSGKTIEFKNNMHSQVMTLPYFNCYAFQNGVESNRIRDDYNEIYIRNGVKASSTLAERYEEERRKTGMIHSGVYNSTSGLNDLNQFIQAEPITKDINPRYGSIQKLFSRDTDIVTICEDKVFKILSDKDALFNADGNQQLLASNKVLGQTTAYAGDYGTQNPESFAADNYRSYFVDRARGAVLRLSMDGITPISSAGMHDWFGDNLKVGAAVTKDTVPSILGSFDSKKSLYNISIRQKGETKSGDPYKAPTDNYYSLSYSEMAKGWVSFMYDTPHTSKYPESGLSINNEYYTWNDGELWKHHSNQTRNNFWGTQFESTITTIMNDNPESIKSFNTINYEGSQAKINMHKATSNVTDAAGNNVSQADGEYYNLQAKTGWEVELLTTNEQTGTVPEFREKEGKWFNYIHGESTVFTDSGDNTLSMDSSSHNLDQHEFSLQGLGIATNVSGTSTENDKYTFTVANNTSTTYNPDTEIDSNTDGAADGVWDSTAD